MSRTIWVYEVTAPNVPSEYLMTRVSSGAFESPVVLSIKMIASQLIKDNKNDDIQSRYMGTLNFDIFCHSLQYNPASSTRR